MAITPETHVANSDSESAHQKAIFCWRGLNLKTYPDLLWLHSSANGGERDSITASKMKAEGVKKGIPDMMLPARRMCPMSDGTFQLSSGLYLELKRPKYRLAKNGGLSEDQIAFGEYAKSQGYSWFAVYGWKEAVTIIEAYLKLDKE